MSHSLLSLKAANTSVMQNSDQITFQLPCLQDQKLLTLYWCSINAHFEVSPIQHLPPSIIILIMIWKYWLPFWQIETQHCGKAEPSNNLALFAPILSKFIHFAEWYKAPTIHLFINRYSPVTAHHSVIVYLYIKLSVKLYKAPLETYRRIVSNFVLIPYSLLVSIPLTVTNPLSALLFEFHVGQINMGTSGVAHPSRCSGFSGSLMALSSTKSDATSSSQSSSLSFGWSKSPVQFSPFSVSELLSGALPISLWTGWRLILFLWPAFNTWVCPPGRSFADRAGGKGDLSDNLNAAAPSCWQSDQDALTISSISEMNPTAVSYLFGPRYSFCVAHRFWLPCHISKKSWTLAIQCYVVSSTTLFISASFSAFAISNAGSLPSNLMLFALPNSPTTSCSRRALPVVFDSLQPITSCPRESLVSTWTWWGMIETMSHATFEWSAYFDCIFSCCRHLSVLSSTQHVLLISDGWEWYSLRFGLPSPQIFGGSGAKFKNSLQTVNKGAGQSLGPGVISATFIGIKYSSSSLNKSYGSNEDWPDSEVVVEGNRMWLCILPG